jgi:hypothetical protein
MNLNGKQIISIIGAVISALMISSAQLTDLLGPNMAKTIVTVAGLTNLILQSVTAAITSQSSTVKDVLAMPGVDKINVNAAANQTLASIAIDPHQDKIAPTQAALVQVTQTAQGT